MASKLKWIKGVAMGNVKAEWVSYVNFRGESCKVVTIRVFRKGEFCLPDQWFKRNSKSLLQKTKSLAAAKKKCQDWWNEFIKSQNK